VSTAAVIPPTTSEAEHGLAISLDDRLREVEARLISWALRTTNGNKSKAAALLGVKRSTLGDRINRCGLGASTSA
jgi:DNA-binding NtrC family response regulator